MVIFGSQAITHTVHASCWELAAIILRRVNLKTNCTSELVLKVYVNWLKHKTGNNLL